ncbi:MAG: PEP-CTERM sorting domain-containing protein [Gemmataceae bacterium]|nr:PEP-CTERM sorting domain-containing protein [Gemmataceae bacterium]
MRFPAPRLYAIALGLCLFAGGQARADLIEWNYNWMPSATEIFANDPSLGKITLTNEAAGSAAGDSFIVATNLKTVSNATASNPAVFTDAMYSLTLTITDPALASDNTKAMTFTGKFDGTLTSKSAMISNTFTSPETQSVQIGTNVYTVKIGAFAPPGPPTATNSGSISALATVTVTEVPEPGTLALAGMCLSVCGAGWWLRRQRALALDLA